MGKLLKKGRFFKSTPKNGSHSNFLSNSEDLNVFIKFCCLDRTGTLGRRGFFKFIDLQGCDMYYINDFATLQQKQKKNSLFSGLAPISSTSLIE